MSPLMSESMALEKPDSKSSVIIHNCKGKGRSMLRPY